MELAELLEPDRDRFRNLLGFLMTLGRSATVAGHRPRILKAGSLSKVPAGSTSNPSLILRVCLFVIDTISTGEVKVERVVLEAIDGKVDKSSTSGS